MAVGAISAGLLAASLGAARGQDEAPVEFRNGQGKATAIALRIAPGVGGLQLSLAAGVSVAEYRNDFAQSQSEALDLGLVGSVLTAPSSCTGRSILPAEVLPKPTRVDNRQGDAAASADAYPSGSTSLGVGRMEAAAKTLPFATARSTPAALDLSPLIKVDPLVADAHTGVVDGITREARATVETSVTILGVLRLSNLRWDALHRTGTNPTAEASFDVGTTSLAGVPVPLETFGPVETVVNDLLATTGVSITFPKVERFTEPADVIRMTPLRIQLKESQLGTDLVSPILGLVRQQREELLDTIATSICELAGVALLADVGLSIVAGTGFLTIDIGGVEATTDDLEIGDPFGDDEPPATIPDAVIPPLPTTGGQFPTLPTTSVTTKPVAEVGPLRDRCESIHAFRDTDCSEGALLAVGLIGLVATAGVGVLDWRYQRRKLTPTEVVA
ncbi:MAG: hypothetical protein M3Z03_01275 [Actinomycetota bacterium]|nr:hypothetical protein [Actinomycetota bacterium]